MYISNISVHKFRMFGDVSVDLNPGLNVIVGENNSGKTGIIDAIRLVLDTTSAEWTRISEDDFHRDSTRFHIRLRFDQIQPEQSHVFVEHLSYEAEEGRGRKPVLYVNLTATLTDSMRRRNRYIRTELRSGHDAEGPAIEREIRDYLSATYLRPLRDAEAELSAGRRSRLAQILSSSDALREQKNFEKLLTDFIKANLNAKNNPGVSATQRSILNHFQKMTFADDDKKFAVAVQILGSKAFSEMSDPEKQRAFQDILSRLSLVLDESRPQQGLGYNNVLFMATELILLEQEANQCPILLIEEPEAHLHPQLQMKFLKFVRDEFSRGSTPTLQTILTSHSPNLASKAPLDSLIVMKDGKAFPMRKGSTKLNYDDYDFLEKFLDVTKANLFFAKAVLIVEGDAENILLPTIAALLGRPLEDYGISIVNVGGTAYARYAKIFPRPGVDERPWEWLPIKVACLRDLDLWPEAADKDARPDVGFISVSDRNKGYWERRKGKDGPFGTDPNEKRKKLERFLKMEDEETDLEPQNVKVCVSEKWTFEYCLARSGLAELVYEAVGGTSEGFKELSDNSEIRAVQIYRHIETKSGAKTDVAYRLAAILEREYGVHGKREQLKACLPGYILDALSHVTGPWPQDLDAASEPEQLPGANENSERAGYTNSDCNKN